MKRIVKIFKIRLTLTWRWHLSYLKVESYGINICICFVLLFIVFFLPFSSWDFEFGKKVWKSSPNRIFLESYKKHNEITSCYIMSKVHVDFFLISCFTFVYLESLLYNSLLYLFKSWEKNIIGAFYKWISIIFPILWIFDQY